MGFRRSKKEQHQVLLLQTSNNNYGWNKYHAGIFGEVNSTPYPCKSKFKSEVWDNWNLIFQLTNAVSDILGNIENLYKYANKREISKIQDEFYEIYKTEDINKLENNESIKMSIDNTTYDITKDMVDIRISSKDGFKAMVDGNNFVILNTTLTKELENEGLARETISKVQQLRKNMNFDIADRINMYLDASLEYKDGINDYLDMIKEETLTLNIYDKEGISEKTLINDFEVGIELEIANK